MIYLAEIAANAEEANKITNVPNDLQSTTEVSKSDIIDDSSICTNEETTIQSVDEEDSAQGTEAIKWVIDNQFKKDLTRLRISDDPKEWSIAQVKHWLQWAVRQFNLVCFRFLSITG